MNRALIMGSCFASACLAGNCGLVHSVFDKAVNIVTSGKNRDIALLTLLCADSDIMPAALISSMSSGSWREYCKIGDYVIFTKDVIYLNSTPLIIGVSDAVIWKSVTCQDIKDLPKLSYEEMIARCEHVELYLEGNGIKKNIFPVESIVHFDVVNLLGLGDGLTPSGDDFLAGMLFAMYFVRMVYKWETDLLSAITDAILQNLTAKTNQISGHFLRYACEGLWGRATERFMLALFENDDDMLYKTIMEKASYGATSGIDEIQGIMFGLRETVRLYGEG